MEDQVCEAQINIVFDELDVIIRVGRDARQLLDRVGSYRFAVLLRHLRRVDFLIEEGGNAGSGPVFLLVLDRPLYLRVRE